QMNVKRAINSDIPRIAGNEAARLFRQNFQNEGFFGKKWKEVNRRGTKTTGYKTKAGKQKTKTVRAGKGADGSRKILTGRTGNLGRSIKVRTEPGTAIIYSDVKYSAAHNSGAQNAGRGRRTKIPQRQFIGNSPELERSVKSKIEYALNFIFKP
ncbi:MAG: phage virion morphogenesis protein, partial [Bacteroidales bacterium]